MKANEAPEKLYFFDGETILSARSKKIEDANIEYIRKDIFIEKVCEWLKKEVEEDYVSCENLIEDFKNYMKE